MKDTQNAKMTPEELTQEIIKLYKNDTKITATDIAKLIQVEYPNNNQKMDQAALVNGIVSTLLEQLPKDSKKIETDTDTLVKALGIQKEYSAVKRREYFRQLPKKILKASVKFMIWLLKLVPNLVIGVSKGLILLLDKVNRGLDTLKANYLKSDSTIESQRKEKKQNLTQHSKGFAKGLISLVQFSLKIVILLLDLFNKFILKPIDNLLNRDRDDEKTINNKLNTAVERIDTKDIVRARANEVKEDLITAKNVGIKGAKAAGNLALQAGTLIKEGGIEGVDKIGSSIQKMKLGEKMTNAGTRVKKGINRIAKQKDKLMKKARGQAM